MAAVSTSREGHTRLGTGVWILRSRTVRVMPQAIRPLQDTAFFSKGNTTLTARLGFNGVGDSTCAPVRDRLTSSAVPPSIWT